MLPTSRSVVYSLLTTVFLLLLGMMTMLRVAYQRYQRLEDQTTDLRRTLSRQESRIKNLQIRLEDCDTLQLQRTVPADSIWNTMITTDTVPDLVR